MTILGWIIKLIDEFLIYATEMKASDIHIKIGNKPMIRVNGELQPISGTEKIIAEHLQIIEDDLMDEEKKAKYKKNKNLDFSYSKSGIGRFRINVFSQRGSTAFAMRKIEENISKIEELGLPVVLKEIIKEKRGLILVTGATGNGKSTTVSAMIEHINETAIKNIITLEDPIEYLFKDKQSLISQREIPNDIESYEVALKYVIRQNPDIIFIGELRDKETVEAAIKAADTGHLVISTMHTVNASQTINRIVDFYDHEHQKQIRYQLSSNLKAVISQRLLPSKTGKKRVPAVEIMRGTPTIREMILTPEGSLGIPEAMKTGKEIYKMQTFDQCISDLLLNGDISYEVAIESATVKKDIELLKGGISYGGASDLYKSML